MTQYNSLNVRLSNSQLNKLKSSIKNETDVVLRISSNMVGNSNDNTNFPHELLLTNRQVANIRKAFANHSSIDIKLSKTQLSKMIQSGGFLGNLLGKLAGPLMKVAMPLAKNVLAILGISAAMSAIDGSIKKIGGFSRDNLPNNNNIKNGAYVINLDEYHDIGTHWVALYVNNKTVTYFHSFGVEHIPKEIMKFIGRKKKSQIFIEYKHMIQ